MTALTLAIVRTAHSQQQALDVSAALGRGGVAGGSGGGAGSTARIPVGGAGGGADSTARIPIVGAGGGGLLARIAAARSGGAGGRVGGGLLAGGSAADGAWELDPDLDDIIRSFQDPDLIPDLDVEWNQADPDSQLK
ncbi:hypothetical protein GPECTOR_161g125 [Gonium pectorale]|uniref:Uncharacterized protein n=1 Tax=Gonium pectorale TaxID=33097 RepID=A0A150FXJ6_GONPE|nr:hypothetical protein GPECTOR_161g125 [Gonium pectorale]|eukprot:KXZ42326.1 hypothetical protein GPECTOR_161g125 [Gonium pectorale]